jgi:sterol desaturase/sphingolipid hydroxylase (fatty acid hydroxylase superfamily)
MNLFTIEQSKAVYRADFAFYGAAILVLAVLLATGAPHAHWQKYACLAAAGVIGWSALEYVVHRFVLHGIQPFQGWHAEHHARPTALICAPTILTASLLGALLFLPVWSMMDLWSACALTLGALIGYLSYAITHHATHHWRAQSTWLRRRRRWHLIHHHQQQQPCCYGVTSGLWDEAFGSTRPAREPRIEFKSR